MKKGFITVAFIMTTFMCLAQTDLDSSSHLTFKAIPLDGTLDQYVSRMKQSGFKHLGTKDGIATLQGDFAGYKDCYVGVSTLKQKDLVHKIAVLFPEKDTWSPLSSIYFNLKQLLTEKYGTPSDVVEKFDSYSEPTDDGARMHELKMDRCKYYSTWATTKGEIQLSISHEGLTNCFVTLMYFDKINSAAIKRQAIDDL